MIPWPYFHGIFPASLSTWDAWVGNSKVFSAGEFILFAAHSQCRNSSIPRGFELAAQSRAFHEPLCGILHSLSLSWGSTCFNLKEKLKEPKSSVWLWHPFGEVCPVYPQLPREGKNHGSSCLQLCFTGDLPVLLLSQCGSSHWEHSLLKCVSTLRGNQHSQFSHLYKTFFSCQPHQSSISQGGRCSMEISRCWGTRTAGPAQNNTRVQDLCHCTSTSARRRWGKSQDRLLRNNLL